MFDKPGVHHPASNNVYSQPIMAAKSVNSLNSSAVAGPSGYDHHAHEARPGRIQDVSAIRDGGARSVTSVAVAMSPADLPRTMTRHGIVHGSVYRGSGPTLLVCPFVASSANGNAT